MFKFNEDVLEQVALEWLEELGYEIVNGPDIAPDSKFPERSSYNDVILSKRLKNALFEFNNHLPRETIMDAYREITIPKQVSLTENNYVFHKMINEGISVSYKDSDGHIKYDRAVLFDFKRPHNNDFLAVNQFTVKEGNTIKRPDIVIFVNGLPLVVFELKTVTDENITVDSAFRQIKNYQNQISSLFVYNSFNVISDGINAKVGTITSNRDWYLSWKTIDGKRVAPQYNSQLEVVIKGMLKKETFMDIIKQFILFQKDGYDYKKILAGYHQYHAVNVALDSTIKATSDEGNRKIGVVWHTQGSGKSLSMVFYAGKIIISEELKNPTIVVITDRNDLDDQLYKTFSQSRDLLRTDPVQAETRAHLKELLEGKTSGGIIFTTIQKFTESESLEPLTKRKNVVVIADEAHRSQYGFAAEVKQITNEAKTRYGYAKYMRDSLPNASYIGFTGTPIETTDKNTRAVFGDYIDVYDMSRAVEDGTTVKIYYESRIAKIDFSPEYDLIDSNYELITEKQEKAEQESLKRKWARLETVVGSKPRLENIAKDIVTHFETRQAAKETEVGKGMIVAMSRKIAINLYKEIVALRSEWHSDDLMKGKIKIVMTGSSSDPEEWQPFIGTKGTRETLARRMKDNNDELELVIVVDMWLTGFDVPSLHTMYIDKPMQGHNLMQAIARVNRVFNEKQGGLIVDYIGIANNLRKALMQYTDSDKKQVGIDTDVAVNVMLEKLDVIQELLHGIDYSEYFITYSNQEKFNIIMKTMDYIIGLGEERKKDYLNLVSELSKAYSLVSTTDEAKKKNVEIGFYKAVRSSIIKISRDNNKRKTKDKLDHELNQLISKSLKSDEVIDIMSEIGFDKPDISILSEEFLEEFKNMEHKNVAAELLRRLIKGKIRAVGKKTIVLSRKFSEMLDDTIRRYQNRLIDSTIVIQELIDLAKNLTKEVEAGKEIGLSEEEYAFYEALASNVTAKEVMGTEVLKDIARELTEKIKASTTIDWNIRETVRAKIRMEIKLLLIKYKYPPDDPNIPNNYDKSVGLVLEQTKLLFENS